MFHRRDVSNALATLKPHLEPISSLWTSGICQKTILGFCGSLVPEKGILDLLELAERHAFAWAQSHVLLIVGRGPLSESVNERCMALNARGFSAHYLGSLSADDMPAYFSLLDILVVPSRTAAHWKEQFGRVIVEAQACGCAVVGSNSGEIPNVIGEAELIFAEGDIEAMARAITHAQRRLETNPTAAREALITRAADRFSDASLAARFVNSLEQAFTS